MATFGTTAVKALHAGGFGNYKGFSGPYSLTETGDLTKISFYCANTLYGGADTYVKCMVHANASDAPTTLLGTTNAVLVADSKAAGWVDFAFATPLHLTAGSYHLCWIADTGGYGLEMYYESGTPGYGNKADTYSDGPSDPFGTPEWSAGYLVSIYATYTVPVTFVPQAILL